MERRAWTRRQMLSMKKLCSIPSGLGFWGAGWLRAFGGAGWLGLGGAGWLTLSQVALLYRRWHPIVPVYVQVALAQVALAQVALHSSSTRYPAIAIT